MPARVCNKCSINWPGAPAWASCLECGGNTMYIHDRVGMPVNVAKTKAFEKFYEARGEKPLHHMVQKRVDRICTQAQQAQDVLLQLRELARSWR